MRIFILLFMLAPLFLWGQYPDNPRKLRLGFQTTGAGLTYIKDGAPAHTPGDDEDAWMVLDTANNVLYYWDETAGAWENILDDITQDTVFQITNVPDTTTLAPMQGDAFINSTADTLGLYNGAGWVLFFGGGSIEVADGLTILGDGTGGDPLRVDTTLLATRTYADSLFLVADSLREAGDRSTPILIQAFDRIIQLDGCSTSETVITGFYLLDNEAIDEGAITFEINSIPVSIITYDVYNADSTSYYFETSVSRAAGIYTWEVGYTDPDGNFVGDMNSFEVAPGTPDTVTVPLNDSVFVTRRCGVEIRRDTIDILPSDNVTGTGASPRVALWSAAQTLTSSANLTYTSPLLTLGGTGASLLLTPTSAPVNAAGKWYTSSGNYPHFMNGTTDWPLVRGSAESFTPGSMLFAGTSGQAQQDNANLFWDDVNNILGVATNTVNTRYKIQANGLIGAIKDMDYIGIDVGESATVNGGMYWRNALNELVFTTAFNLYPLVFGNNWVVFKPTGDVGIGTTSPQRKLHVAGEARITDLTTDTPTRIVGADADGDLAEMTAGTGISFAGGQVSATFDISDVGVNLAADDVPVWDGDEFQPSGIKSNGSTILLTADFPFLGGYLGAPGVTENGYVLTYDNAEGGIILKEGGIPRQFVGNVEVAMNEYTLLIGDAVGIAIDPTPGSETMTIGASPDSPGGPSPQITFDAVSNNVLVGMNFGMVFEADNGIAGFARMGAQGGGTGPLSSPNVTVFENSLIRVNSPDISFPSTEESTELGQVKVLVLEDSMLFYKDMILDKQSATFYEEVERQYTLGTSPSADTVITVDTIGVAFAADSISIAAGLITNDRSTTVTWLVHYDFTYNSDEDPCYSFFDLTTDGSEVPAAIAGSSAYSNQVSVLGTQHPGRSFLVNVPSGQAIRLCVKGNILAATEMNISYLTISIEEK